jgi:hypothetical protein
VSGLLTLACLGTQLATYPQLSRDRVYLEVLRTLMLDRAELRPTVAEPEVSRHRCDHET